MIQMYDLIYSNIASAINTEESEEIVYINKDGKIIDHSDNANNNLIYEDKPNLPLGLPCSQKMLHP